MKTYSKSNLISKQKQPDSFVNGDNGKKVIYKSIRENKLLFLFNLTICKRLHILKSIYRKAEPQQLTSRRLASFLLYLENRLQKRFPQQQATWTRGPSFPRLSPEDTAKTSVTGLISRVHLPR